jgi:hypothetical protein
MKGIKCFPKCDILIHKNDVSRLGYEKGDKTLGQMIDLAILHKCPIIIERARGKWYLKGQGYSRSDLKKMIEENLQNTQLVKEYNSRCCYLVKL